jgi:protein TonB
MATTLASRNAPERTRLYPAAALALIVEALVLGGTLAFLSHKPPKPVEPTVTVLAIARAPDPAPAPVQQPKPPEPKPQPVAHPPVHVRHVVHVVPPQPPAPAQAPLPQPSLRSAAPTEAPSAPPPPPPPAAATAASPTAPPASFESEMRAAIQAALRYPESARMAGMSGRTRVGFQYRDGVASDVTILVSSGSGLLDRAALAAVRDAAYPKPVPAFVGKTLTEQLWVTFDLNKQQ